MQQTTPPPGENSPTWDGRPPNPERSGEICGLCHGAGETDSVVSHEPASGDTQAALCVTGETQHQSTEQPRWAVIRCGAGAREVVDTWRYRDDAQAEAMRLMTLRRDTATAYYVVEPAT